jgi:xanthine/uracil/vitamin C permease (AzgA family)
LHARRVRGSILWGIIVATALACLLKLALTLTSAFMSVMQGLINRCLGLVVAGLFLFALFFSPLIAMI